MLILGYLYLVLSLDQFLLVVELALRVSLQIQGLTPVVRLLYPQLALIHIFLPSEVARSIFVLLKPSLERFLFVDACLGRKLLRLIKDNLGGVGAIHECRLVLRPL